MPHCTTNFAWYFGKFLLGFTGMLILYMGFLKDSELYPCKSEMRGPLMDKKGENDNICSPADQRGMKAPKRYKNRGKCGQRERCYPRMIASEYLVKSNNAMDMKMKHGKLLELALNPERRYKCRWCNSYIGQRSNRFKKRTCLRIPLCQDTIANLWNVEKVCEGLHCVRSQDNDASRSLVKKNDGQLQEEFKNIEKFTQEETTSSSYVDAKNCFVQDACIQTVYEKRKEMRLAKFSNQCEKEDKENTELPPPKDLSFICYEHNETTLEDKHEQISLNCDCELPIVEELTNSVNVGTSISLEQIEKSNIKDMGSVSNSCTCIPHVPELRLERKCGCHPTLHSKYQFVERRFNENGIERQLKYDEKDRTSRLYYNRNRWNSEITSPSSCESNRYTSNDLRSSTSTESMSSPRTKAKIISINRNRQPFMFFDKSIKIGEGPWRKNDEMILKNSTSSLIQKIKTKEDYSDQIDQFICRCDYMDHEAISDGKFEHSETVRSRTSFSSSSFSSYDNDRSPRSFSRYTNCVCRNLTSVASSTSTCTGVLASEIEHRRVKESSKVLNPLSLTSRITYSNNRNGCFNITRFTSQKTLSVMQKRRKENYKRIND